MKDPPNHGASSCSNADAAIQSDPESPDWFASVSVLDDGGYEVELREARHREYELTVQHSIGRMAQDVTIWVASRCGAVTGLSEPGIACSMSIPLRASL